MSETTLDTEKTLPATAPGAAQLDRPTPAGQRSPLVLAWRQYRLERRMFWRNPSAAFFNFLLPLIFLTFFGAILRGNRSALAHVVPGIAGLSVVATTFTALAYNIVYLRERGVLKRI